MNLNSILSNTPYYPTQVGISEDSMPTNTGMPFDPAHTTTNSSEQMQQVTTPSKERADDTASKEFCSSNPSAISDQQTKQITTQTEEPIPVILYGQLEHKTIIQGNSIDSNVSKNLSSQSIDYGLISKKNSENNKKNIKISKSNAGKLSGITQQRSGGPSIQPDQPFFVPFNQQFQQGTASIEILMFHNITFSPSNRETSMDPNFEENVKQILIGLKTDMKTSLERLLYIDRSIFMAQKTGDQDKVEKLQETQIDLLTQADIYTKKFTFDTLTQLPCVKDVRCITWFSSVQADGVETVLPPYFNGILQDKLHVMMYDFKKDLNTHNAFLKVVIDNVYADIPYNFNNLISKIIIVALPQVDIARDDSREIYGVKLFIFSDF